MRAFAMVLNQLWSSYGNLPYATDANLLISALVRHSGAFIERGRRVSSPVLSLPQHLDEGAVIESSHWLCECCREISSINYSRRTLLSIEKDSHFNSSRHQCSSYVQT